jgi:hypothetical protein
MSCIPYLDTISRENYDGQSVQVTLGDDRKGAIVVVIAW